MRHAMAFLLILLAMSFGFGRAQAATRTYATADLIIPCTGTTSCTVEPTNGALAMPGACNSSASADFAARDALPQIPTSSTPSRWGPYPITYQAVSASQIPAECNPKAWAWRRLQEAILKTVAAGMNYCHHHAPAYEAVAPYRIWCNGTNDDTCVCNKAGENRTLPWNGLDCSNYASYLYNYAFGYYPSSNIDSQACAPTAAPGRLLSTVSITQQQLFRTGDLLYITGSSTSPGVTHVVIFTGWQVDFTPGATGMLANSTLVNNVSPASRTSVVSCIKKRVAAGLPVWVVADSTYTGPNLRPLCGWYTSSFSHARRIINPDTNLYPETSNTTVAVYDTTNSDCISKAVLRT